MDKPKIMSVSGKDAEEKGREALGVPELPGGEPEPKKPSVTHVQPEPVAPASGPELVAEPVSPAPKTEPDAESEIPPERLEPSGEDESPFAHQEEPYEVDDPAPVAAVESEHSPASKPVSSQPLAPAPSLPKEPSPPEPEKPVGPKPPDTTASPEPVPVEPEPEEPAPEPSQTPAVPSLQPQAPPWVARNQPRPKVFSRPEFDDREGEAFARDMLSDSKPRIVARRDVAQEYREQASRDILPPQVPPRPLTVEEQRLHAKGLAQKIYEEKQGEGFFSKLRRRLGWR